MKKSSVLIKTKLLYRVGQQPDSGFPKVRKPFRFFVSAALFTLSLLALPSCSNLFDSSSTSEKSKLLFLQNLTSNSTAQASAAQNSYCATVTGTLSLQQGAYPASVIAAINAAQKSLAHSAETLSTASSAGDGTFGNLTPAKILKSATASVPPDITDLETYTYHATATNKDTGEKIEANPTDFLLTDGSVFFSMSVPYGTWIFETTIKNSADTVIYKSQEVERTLSAENSIFRADFTLNPLQTADGSGKVLLDIKVPSSVNAVTMQLVDGEESNWPSGYFTTGGEKSLALYGTQKHVTIGNLVIVIGTGEVASAMSVKSGIYRVQLKFYDSSAAENRNLLYTAFQTINVYDGLTTNRWTAPSSTSSISAIKSDGTFEVTQELIELSALTNFYVDGENGDDANSGSFYAPARTLSKAIGTISAVGLGDKDYTINIMGTVTPKTGTTTTELPSSLDSKLKSLTIQGTTGSETDILDGQKKGSVLTIATSKPVTIKNLKITNGKSSSGGGIYMGSGADVTLSNSVVEKNESSGYGGGIAVYCAKLAIEGSSITENKTTTQNEGVGGGIGMKGNDTVTAEVSMDEDSVISGNTAFSNKNGGGVSLYIGKTKFTMTGGEISGNSAYCGGGIDLCENAEFIMEDGKISGNNATHSSGTVCGGGVYIRGKGSFTMSGGEISGNTAKDDGGAVAFERECTEAKFTMTGGKISGNEAPCAGGIYARNGTVSITGGEISGNSASGTSGGGIYCGGPSDTDPDKNGTVTVGGSAVIKGNRANKFGGGVFIEYGKTFSLAGGTIGGSSAEEANSAEQGGGIYVAGSLTMDGGLVKGNTVSEDGGGLYASGETEITGGTIESNSAASRGGGVFMNNGSLVLGGSISIPVGSDKKNDLYLVKGKTVALSSPLPAGTTAATITPEEYADGTQLLSLAESSSTMIENEYVKFSIKQQSEQLDIFDISNEGYLTNVIFSFDRVFPNGTVYGTETHEDKPYIVIKYSYLNYDNLKLDVRNPFANMGWNMVFKLDGTTTDPATATTLSDGYHTLSATLTKGSENVTATTRVHAMIKPVTVTVPSVTSFQTRDQGVRFYFSGEMYIQAKNDGNDTERQTIKAWDELSDNSGYLNKTLQTNSNSNSVILTAPDSTFYFYTSLADDTSDGNVSCGKVNKGWSYTTKTLAQLKADMNASYAYSFDSQAVNSSGNLCNDSGRRSHYWFDVTLNDDD